jgi:hypothetical protein
VAELVPRAGATTLLERWLQDGMLVLLGLALVKLLVHLATAGRYGFHRDELYYLAAGQHLSLGYVDYPPLTAMVARLSTLVFGHSLVGLRVWPAIAGAVIVVLGGLIARELGGGRSAQVLAAVLVLCSPMFLGGNSMFQTVTFDQLMWAICMYLVARLLARGGSPRLWLGDRGRLRGRARDQIHHPGARHRSRGRPGPHRAAALARHFLAVAGRRDRRRDARAQPRVAGHP